MLTDLLEELKLKQPKNAIRQHILAEEDTFKDTSFPEMLNIGSLRVKYGEKIVPALFPLNGISGMCFLTTNDNRNLINQALQKIAIRIICSFPIGRAKFTFIDSTGLGQNFKFISKISSKIIGDKILTEPKEIERALVDLKNDTTNIIQKVLGYEYSTLQEYNETAGELAEPYTFLFLANYPRKIKREHSEQILSLLESGYKAGVFVIMSLDTTFQPASNYDIDPFQFVSAMPTIYQVDNQFYVKNVSFQEYFNTKYEFSLDTEIPENITELVNEINTRSENIKRVEVDLSRLLTKRNLWSEDASKNLSIPVGKINQLEIQNFGLGVKENVHHGLLGGMTGSGKTVLLHNIICNAAWLYSPEDLQFVLMDYKEGTEFKRYAPLPHVKVLSINSEREFGLSVFEYLEDEIERRGELFKKYDVSNLSDYRGKANAILPRLLVIVDEFQVLISDSDKISREVARLMDDIAKRGRSFGVNMLLCTQTLGEVMLKSSTLSQLGLRMAMKLHPNDCYKILSKDNDLPIYFDKPGEAVYNIKNGLSEGNIKFQVGYLSDKTINRILDDLNKSSEEKGTTKHKKFISDGTLSADIEANKDLKKELTQPLVQDKFVDVYIGEPFHLDEKHAFFRLRRQEDSNLLILGKDKRSAVSIMYHGLWQIIKKSSKQSEFYILDLFSVDNEFKGYLNKLSEETGANIVTGGSQKDVVPRIEEVYNLLQKRVNNDVEDKFRVVLTMMNFNKPLSKKGIIKDSKQLSPRSITREIDESGREAILAKYLKSEPASKTNKTTQKPTQNQPNLLPIEQLMFILTEGPAYGVHTFIYSASNAAFNQLWGMQQRNILASFDTRIALKGEDSIKILGNNLLSNNTLVNNIGYVKSPYTKYEVDKFKVYSI